LIRGVSIEALKAPFDPYKCVKSRWCDATTAALRALRRGRVCRSVVGSLGFRRKMPRVALRIGSLPCTRFVDEPPLLVTSRPAQIPCPGGVQPLDVRHGKGDAQPLACEGNVTPREFFAHRLPLSVESSLTSVDPPLPDEAFKI